MTLMSFHKRHRLRIAILVIFGLLFQQIAMAAFVCAPLSMPADPAAMVEDCTQMAMDPAPVTADVCAAYCAPDWTLVADQVTLRVPALSLPPAEFAPVLVSPAMHVAMRAAVPLRRSDPPPRLRYCSLQI